MIASVVKILLKSWGVNRRGSPAPPVRPVPASVSLIQPRMVSAAIGRWFGADAPLEQRGRRRPPVALAVVVGLDERNGAVGGADAVDEDGEHVGELGRDDEQTFDVGLGRGDVQQGDELPGAGNPVKKATLDLSAAGGYTTELLARAIGPSGTVYGQSRPLDSPDARTPSRAGGQQQPDHYTQYGVGDAGDRATSILRRPG